MPNDILPFSYHKNNIAKYRNFTRIDTLMKKLKEEGQVQICWVLSMADIDTNLSQNITFLFKNIRKSKKLNLNLNWNFSVGLLSCYGCQM